MNFFRKPDQKQTKQNCIQKELWNLLMSRIQVSEDHKDLTSCCLENNDFSYSPGRNQYYVLLAVLKFSDK